MDPEGANVPRTPYRTASETVKEGRVNHSALRPLHVHTEAALRGYARRERDGGVIWRREDKGNKGLGLAWRPAFPHKSKWRHKTSSSRVGKSKEWSGEGQPQRFKGHIQSRLLTDDGKNFQEFSSEWSHVHAQDVAHALRVHGWWLEEGRKKNKTIKACKIV